MNLAPLPVTEQALERAGLRLDLAASIFNEVCRAPSDEQKFGAAEEEFLNARSNFRCVLTAYTGLDMETLERRLGL